MLDQLPISIWGHVHIKDDLENVLVNKGNAVHPQNMARVIARALANEHNFYVYRIAFGNGGTQTDAAYTITYKTPNDGQAPDVRTWDSRLYNETYSEIIDDSVSPTSLLGTDPGSAGPNAGTRAGGGADPSGDPPTVEHVSGPGVRSNELGLTSEVVITAVLNPSEPTGQFGTDDQGPTEDTETSFTFDEIGLYTSGGDASDSNGSQDIDVGNKTSEDDTGLLGSTLYSFIINADGAGATQISFTTPATGSGAGGEILYGDLCEALNTVDPVWAVSAALPGSSSVAITDNTLSFPSITGAQTFGFLRFTSGTTGSSSSIALAAGTVGTDMIASVNPTAGGTIETAVAGQDAGVQNDPVNFDTERERLLTHIIFSPVLKSANRTLTVTYTLTISVARTQS